MSEEVEKCPILHVCPKFDVFTLIGYGNFASLFENVEMDEC